MARRLSCRKHVVLYSIFTYYKPTIILLKTGNFYIDTHTQKNQAPGDFIWLLPDSKGKGQTIPAISLRIIP